MAMIAEDFEDGNLSWCPFKVWCEVDGELSDTTRQGILHGSTLYSLLGATR